LRRVAASNRFDHACGIGVKRIRVPTREFLETFIQAEVDALQIHLTTAAEAPHLVKITLAQL
jgi:hypothetical protein